MKNTFSQRTSNTIPVRAGIGLRAEHYKDVVDRQPDIGWFEIHSENYFGSGGPPLYYLEKIRAQYPISFHGVGLSLGSTDPLNVKHLKKLKGLIDNFDPGLVSEHLSWSSVGGRYFNDLFPLPYTQEALDHIVDRIKKVQDFINHRLLIENVSSYLQFESSHIPEWEFITEVAQQADCGILLDVNNVYVNSKNHEYDASRFLNAVPVHLVEEIHLAGHTKNRFEDRDILIDSHNQLVADDVWALYSQAVSRFGSKPVLIEWDTDLPALSVLLNEAHKADLILGEFYALIA